MPVDADFIQRSLQRIVEEEERVILRKLSDVDTQFVKAGQGGGSSRWTMERHRVTEEGVAHAAELIKKEVRELAGEDAPKFADVGEAAVGHLGHRLLGQYRTSLGPTKDVLIAALLKIKAATRDDLTHRPVQAAPAPGSLAGRDININATGHVAVAGRDAHQHVEGFDAAGLVDVLAKVKDMIEASQATADQRERLSDDLASFEVMAHQPKPDIGRLGRMTKRLVGVLKEVSIPAAAGLLEACAKQRLGLP
jgi:hypothetical protein